MSSVYGCKDRCVAKGALGARAPLLLVEPTLQLGM